MIKLEGVDAGTVYMLQEEDIASVVLVPAGMRIFLKGGKDGFEISSEQMDLQRAAYVIEQGMKSASKGNIYHMKRKGDPGS